jgi:hypothetical protein
MHSTHIKINKYAPCAQQVTTQHITENGMSKDKGRKEVKKPKQSKVKV